MTRAPSPRLRRAYSRGFAVAEAVLLACLLAGLCVLVGKQLSAGANTAANAINAEIATGQAPPPPPPPPVATE